MKSALKAGLLVLAAGLMVGGCGSPARQQLNEVRMNPSPVEETLTQRQDDIDNQMTVTFDTNLRSFNRDLGVLFMTNKPSMLSPHPVR
jgi:hypothetical protein